jgi:hypothetical protein
MDIWTAIIYIAISLFINYSLQPKAQVQPPAAFEDFDFPQADEGTPQAVIFGDCWSEDWMVLAVGNYRNTEIR